MVAIARSRVFKVSHHLVFRLAGVARYRLAAATTPALPGGGQQGWRLAGGSDLWLAVQTSHGPGATLIPRQID
jgi:hypothetical protein